MRFLPSARRCASALALCLAVLAAAACGDPAVPPAAESDATDRPARDPDWSEATHGKATPAYGVVFPQDSVNRIDIAMTAAQWEAIQRDITRLWGFSFGAGGAAGATPPDIDPAYVDVTVTFGGRRWRHVGFRLKGHQSLLFSWRNGVRKLPFRLHFDWFEDSIPAVRGQRFHGFQELSFAPGFSDPSLMRDRVAAELFRAAGVPAAETAFYRVYVDFGEGPRYCGVYTTVEVIDDTMVERWFGDEGGNVYKPESRWSAFSAADFEKKTNEAEADWSDVRAAVDALNAPLRREDPAAWRAGLETVLDVDHFLRWLAVSTALVNKDSYGDQAHNYYLYAHPARGLVWIPWDHNLSMRGSPGLSGRASRDGLSLALDEVRDEWPLIRYLLDDPVFAARYEAHLRSVAEVLTPARTDAMVEAYRRLLAPWVEGAQGEVAGYTHLAAPGAWAAGREELRRHLRDRSALLERFAAGER